MNHTGQEGPGRRRADLGEHGRGARQAMETCAAYWVDSTSSEILAIVQIQINEDGRRDSSAILPLSPKPPHGSAELDDSIHSESRQQPIQAGSSQRPKVRSMQNHTQGDVAPQAKADREDDPFTGHW